MIMRTGGAPDDPKPKADIRNSDGNFVNVGNFDADGANVNRNRPRNSNGNLGVCFSRTVGKNSRLLVASFCCLNKPAEHFANLNGFFRKFGISGVVETFCFVGEAQMHKKHF